MKKTRILLLMLVALVAGLLASCTDVEAQLTEAEAELVSNYADTIGSSSFEVTEDLALVTSVGEDATISWSSSNTDVIANDGTVTRQQDDVTVTLTATITIGEDKLTHDFEVVVAMIPAADQVAAAKLALETRYASTIGDDTYDVTNDLTLVTSEAGVSVSWVSSDTSIIANDGTVTRPSFTTGSQNVTLTATLTKGDVTDTVVFYAYVVQLDKTAAETVSEVFDIVVTFPANEGLTGSEEWLGTVDGIAAFLPTYSYEGTEFTIAWTSDNAALAIADGEGTVTRPATGEDDVTVTVTATIVYGGETFTRTYEFKVLAFEAPTVVASVADIFDVASGDYVQVNGVTVIAIVGTNAFISDGTNIIYVYDSAFGNNVQVGSVYDVAGVFSPYYGIPELTSETGLPLIATASEDTAVSLEGTESTIAALLDGRTAPNDLNIMIFEYVQLTVKVVVDAQDTNSGSNYNTYLVPVSYEGTEVITNVGTDGKATEYATDDVLLVYYGSPNKDAVAALDGKTITIDVLLYGYRSDRNIWYTYFFGDSEDITVHLNDAESVAAAQENLPGEFPEVFYEGDTLSLPSDLYGTTITYTSSDDAVINPTTGAVAIPASGQTDVTLTATISKGEETPVEVAIVVTVGVPDNSNISDVKALDSGEVVMVTGVITAAEYQNTYFIQDATGGLAIYSSNDTVEAFLQANYGNEVSIVGFTGSFRGLEQISPDSDFLTVTNDVDAVMPTAMNVDAVALSDDLLPYQGQIVEMTGLYVSEKDSDNYGNVYVTFVRLSDGSEIDMKWDSRVDLSTEATAALASVTVGSIVDIVNPLAWNNAPYFYFTDTTSVTLGTLSDVDAVAAVKTFLPESFMFEEDILADFTLELPTTSVGVAISWASSDDTVINPTTGAVTVPTDGSQVSITLTASLSKGTETDEVEIVILVGETPPISISDARLVEEGLEVKVQGIVTAETDGTFYIQDDTAGIAVYVKYDENSDTSIAFLQSNIGNEIKVVGIMDSYNGLVEITDVTVLEVIDAEAAAVVPADLAAVDLGSNLITYQGQLVSLPHMYLSGISGSSDMTYTFTRTSTGETISLRFDKDVTLGTELQAIKDALAVGQVYDITAALGWFYNGQLVFSAETVLTAGTLNDQDLAYLDAMDVEIETAFTEAGTITLPTAGTNGSTIAWTSDNALINAETGAVTLPAEEGSVNVTLTAVVTLNAASYEFDVVVSVTKLPAQASVATDLFISEYIEGSSSNKTIEIYNGTGADVNLTGYTLELWSNGATEATSTYQLTGTLAAGDVFVLANSAAIAEILAEADDSQAYPSVPNWNGDDAVTLSKNGTVIDIIGLVGERVIWPAGTGSTQNYTIVRAATVTSPNAVYDANEWVAYAQDTVEYLGSHTMN